MKNILIVNSSHSDPAFTDFISDVNDITDPDLKEMIENVINGVHDWKKDDLWIIYGECGSDRGFVFNEYVRRPIEYPITVEHEVTYYTGN